jgi:hypothetical protein
MPGLAKAGPVHSLTLVPTALLQSPPPPLLQSTDCVPTALVHRLHLHQTIVLIYSYISAFLF